MSRTYKCSGCKRLFRGPEGKHGDVCPNECRMGFLHVITRITKRMLDEAEVSQEMREALGR